MRFTLRVWRSRYTNNEKLRNQDRKYPGKWDALILSNRELTEREKLRRLHARSQVDDVGDLDPYESSDEGSDAGDQEFEPKNVQDPQADEANDTVHGRSAQEASPKSLIGASPAEQHSDADDQESAHEHDQGDDESDKDDDEDENETVDGDEELAALRAEAQDAGEDLGENQDDTRHRSRNPRNASASAADGDLTNPSREPNATQAMDQE
jgi:RNA polymerase II-associated factor 1